MELSKVNHVITAVMSMLDILVDQAIIGNEIRKELAPVLVAIVLKNESVQVEET